MERVVVIQYTVWLIDTAGSCFSQNIWCQGPHQMKDECWMSFNVWMKVIIRINTVFHCWWDNRKMTKRAWGEQVTVNL